MNVRGRSGSRYQVQADLLNRGGQADLYLCRDDRGSTRVLKKYNKPITAHAAVEQVARLSALGRGIVLNAEGTNGDRKLGRTTETSVNWPIDVVDGHQGIDAVVLPLIPDSFMRLNSKGERHPRTLDFLGMARADPPAADVRVGVLIRICDILVMLDGRALTHGDISWKNIVWREDDTHAYLIDCDGLWPHHPPPTSGPSTNEWQDPRLIRRRVPAHDHYSDRYALALVLYRGLFLNSGGPRWSEAGPRGRWIKASNFPDRLDPTLRGLFARAFDRPDDTAGRPRPSEWRDALHRVYLVSGSRPTYRRDALRVLDDYADRFRDSVGPAAAQRRGTALVPVPAARAVGRGAVAPVGGPSRAPAPVGRPAGAAPAGTGAAVRRTGTPTPPAPGAARPVRSGARRGRGWGAGLILGTVAVAALARWTVENGEGTAPRGSVPRTVSAVDCPKEIVADLPVAERSGAELMRRYRTSEHLITVCRTSDGGFYYHGAWRKGDPDSTITIPAQATDDGYRAERGGYVYAISGDTVTVSVPGQAPKEYALTVIEQR
ncbi:hypothetical protein C6Y14_38395 [Streptomyces dioscori]|uniref:Protein kinase domain-containing protein n=1 Tax=Streptomyces dioscori TaxID=2109333 RepID=A0A2P8PW53_9ACTN|nr:hypothetical protein [Streptomyces dioscori]PSM38211.1 hypothetical protein C6Y14_38395 [Streptomyces dioscori]